MIKPTVSQRHKQFQRICGMIHNIYSKLVSGILLGRVGHRTEKGGCSLGIGDQRILQLLHRIRQLNFACVLP